MERRYFELVSGTDLSQHDTSFVVFSPRGRKNGDSHPIAALKLKVRFFPEPEPLVVLAVFNILSRVETENFRGENLPG